MTVPTEIAEETASILGREYPEARCALNFSSAFQLTVATVLSAQTTDVRVNQVTVELFQRWPTPAALAGADRAELEAVVRPLGMFRRRAEALIGLGAGLVADFGGQVPGTREELMTLPGVGRKTANVVLGNWFGQEEITVDTHVGRLSRRLGWSDNTDPRKVEADLWRLMPRAPWTLLCHQMIEHGRQVCHSRAPQCAGCALNQLCPRRGV